MPHDSAPARLVARGLAAAMAALVLSSTAHADIARIPDRGPRSGSGFSNPGRALDPTRQAPVAMRSAAVTVRLERADDDRLRARCSATFELEHVGAAGSPVEFMVAFPVTGLAVGQGDRSSLHLNAFDVVVDDARPSLVQRRTVYIGYYQGRHYGPEDVSVRGALEGRFAPPKIEYGPNAAARDAAGELTARSAVAGHPAGATHWNGITLADESAYSCSYLWTQEIVPGKKQRVVITYELMLRAQNPRTGHSRDYWSDARSSEAVAGLDQARDYYLFDYVLKSGATWEGPIGKETITLSAERGIELGSLVSVGRKPARRGPEWVWEIVNEKPTEDVLVALPK